MRDASSELETGATLRVKVFATVIVTSRRIVSKLIITPFSDRSPSSWVEGRGEVARAQNDVRVT